MYQVKIMDHCGGRCIDDKAQGLVELSCMCNIPSAFVIPGCVFYTYAEADAEEKRLCRQKLQESILGFVSETSSNDLGLYSIRCSSKRIKNIDRAFPQTVINIGVMDSNKEELLHEGYAVEFVSELKDNYNSGLMQFKRQTKCPDVNSASLPTHAQLLEILISIYDYFDSIKHLAERDRKDFTVLIQKMVFGNLDARSCSGMCYTRNPYTGKVEDYGRYARKKQGFSCVPAAELTDLSELQNQDQAVYDQLQQLMIAVEKKYSDIRYLEYTVQSGKLYILQNTTGNRTYRLRDGEIRL